MYECTCRPRNMASLLVEHLFTYDAIAPAMTRSGSGSVTKVSNKIKPSVSEKKVTQSNPLIRMVHRKINDTYSFNL